MKPRSCSFVGASLQELRKFIQSFYASSSTSQNIDNAFIDFVWSQLVSLPEIRIGSYDQEVVPATQQQENVEATPAPEPLTKESKKAARAQIRGRGRSLMDARLDKGPRSVFTPATKPVDADSKDWRLRPAMEARFGSKLRMTVDEETAWLSLTGSHSRVS